MAPSESGWADWRFSPSKAPARRTNRRADGRRLLIASAVLGGVGLVVNTSRAVGFSYTCKKSGYHYDDGCFSSQPALWTAFVGAPALAVNLTGAVLGARGAYLRGSVGPRVSAQETSRHVVWGSVMLGLGVVGQIASALVVRSVYRVDSDAIYDGELDGDGFRRRYSVATLGAQAGAMLTATGGGLLTHGLAQRKRSLEVGFSATGFSLRF